MILYFFIVTEKLNHMMLFFRPNCFLLNINGMIYHNHVSCHGWVAIPQAFNLTHPGFKGSWRDKKSIQPCTFLLESRGMAWSISASSAEGHLSLHWSHRGVESSKFREIIKSLKPWADTGSSLIVCKNKPEKAFGELFVKNLSSASKVSAHYSCFHVVETAAKAGSIWTGCPLLEHCNSSLSSR